MVVSIPSEPGRRGARWESCRPREVRAVRRPLARRGAVPAGLRVLVVDQSPRTRGAMERLLRGEGHTVCAVADGAGALDLAARCCFDLVITDLGRPGAPEVGLLRELLRLPRPAESPAPRGIAVTALDPHDFGGAAEVLRGGGYDLLMTKPIHFKELSEAIRHVAVTA